MIGLDTNILARYYIDDKSDSEAQKQQVIARTVIESGKELMVCKTVLLELEWVMRGYYRFTPYHRLDFSWYNMELSGHKKILDDIDFGDITIPAGFVVDSILNIETFKAAYNYSFFRAKEIEVALTVGLHTMKINMDMETVEKDKKKS